MRFASFGLFAGPWRAVKDHRDPMIAASPNVKQILNLEVPILVRVAERTMKVGEVLAWVPGSIIELPKQADAELDLMVNNKPIGCGSAVKVGENFGLRINFIGDIRQRIEALKGGPPGPGGGVPAAGGPSPEEAAAEAMLAGQR